MFTDMWIETSSLEWLIGHARVFEDNYLGVKGKHITSTGHMPSLSCMSLI